jgi:hypothetical protein
LQKELKNNYKEIFLPCPRCNDYFNLEQLAEILEKKGVQKKTIEQIYNDIMAHQEFDYYGSFMI